MDEPDWFDESVEKAKRIPPEYVRSTMDIEPGPPLPRRTPSPFVPPYNDGMHSDPDLIDDPDLEELARKAGRFAESRHGIRWLGLDLILMDGLGQSGLVQAGVGVGSGMSGDCY